MNIASRGATMAVDWEQRVDFDRLRRARLERTKAALEASDLGALLLFDPNNLRYVTSTHDRDVGARQEHPLRARLPRRRPDPLGLRLGGAAPPALLPVAARVELARLGLADARRDADETGVPDMLAAMIHDELRERGLHEEPLGIDVPDMATLLALQRHGLAPRRRAAGDARGAQDQDRRRDRAARPRGGDRRRGLRGDLPHAAPGRARERGRRGRDAAALRARLRARRGDQRRSPATAATRTRTSSPTGCCAPATRRSSTSSTRSWATGRATTARSASATRRPPSSTRTSSAASGSTRDRARPARASRPTRSPRCGRRPRRSACATRRPRSGSSSGTGSASASTSSPMISRLHSLDEPVEIEVGMVFALETYCAASDGRSAARIEEEVVVTPTGPR